MKRIFGLLGKNIEYSFSPSYFKDKFKKENIQNTDYQIFDKSNDTEIYELKNIKNLQGFNVTIPYKRSVLDFLDIISPEAEKIGAINCVKIVNGKWHGFNTDFIGFINSIQPLLKSHHKKALILGTGGASSAVAFALATINIEFDYVSRNPLLNQHSYNDFNDYISDYQIIINCTPLGTHPNIDEIPQIRFDKINKDYLVYDLIYNPAETRLLKEAKEKGAQIKNGLEMLEIQAEESWKIWNNESSI